MLPGITTNLFLIEAVLNIKAVTSRPAAGKEDFIIGKQRKNGGTNFNLVCSSEKGDDVFSGITTSLMLISAIPQIKAAYEKAFCYYVYIKPW